MIETLRPGRTVNPAYDEGPHRAMRHACLIVALDAAHPLDPPSRHWLVDIDEVSLGRSDKDRAWSRSDDQGVRKLRLRVKDDQVSGKHAMLRRESGRWMIQDDGSTNGTFVNGAATAQAALSDGDVVRLGRTFFVYREAVPAESLTHLDLRADDRDVLALPIGVRTMSPALEDQFAKLIAMARSKGSIVILGETGTGKELLASAVHELSRRAGDLVIVNCGGLPETLIESELFGHKKGAFSGAVADKDGLIAASDGGTLFLDEIGELPLAAQAALLRALQDGEIRPIGATSARKVDLRVVAATNRDLPQLVKEKRFRADLWARLKGFTAHPVPLRERREDLGLLLSSLLPRPTTGPAPASLSVAAANLLFAHHWPLNIRELEKAVEYAKTLAAGKQLDVKHWPDELVVARPAVDADEALRQQLVALLREHKGNLADVGRAIVPPKARQQIHKWCQRLGIDPDEFRDRPRHGSPAE